MLTIHDNIQLTRKHRVCHILNDTGGLMWSGKCAGQAIEWLYLNDHQEARVIGEDGDYELKITRFPI